MKYALILITSLFLTGLPAFQARADRDSECKRLKELERETGCPESVSADPNRGAEAENDVVRSEFGPSRCVVYDAADKEKDVLKRECEKWVKERKADLGANFLTSTCNAECGPCPKNESLKRCSLKGEVHFR